MLDDELLTTRQAATLLQCSISWLAKLRMKGRGPKWCRIGARMVRYRMRDVTAYVECGLRVSTSHDTVIGHANGFAP